MKGQKMKKTWILIIVIMAAGLVSGPTISQAFLEKRINRPQTNSNIPVVENRKQPLYGGFEFELKEVLSIGKEDDIDYVFSSINNLSVDSLGKIYVSDARARRVQVFDKDGHYLMTLGREGQGPGEFVICRLLGISPEGDIYISSGIRRVEVFQKDGSYKRTIAVDFSLRNLQFNSEGTPFGLIQYVEEEKGYLREFVKLNPTFQVKKSLFKSPYTLSTFTEGGANITVSTGYEHGLLIGKRPQGFFVGNSAEYTIYLLNEEGDKELKIKKDGPPRKIPASKRKRSGKIPLPDYQPFFYRFHSDNLGRIYAETENPNFTEEITTADVFSPDGHYLYQIKMPHRTFIIDDGYLYCVEMNEERGLLLMKRYLISNWSSMKIKAE